MNKMFDVADFHCMEELVKAAGINFRGKKPHSVYLGLPTMLQRSEEARIEKQDELAYIFLKRWLLSIEWIRKTRDYKADTSKYSTNMTVNQINEVKEILGELEKKLKLMYELCSSKHNDTVEHKEIETGVTKSYTSRNDIGLKLPEIPTDNPLYGYNDEFILCNELYNLLQKTDRYLIIDIRQKFNYDISRILSNNCINIPQSEIKQGHSYDLYNHRSANHVDIIILLDWNTTQGSLSNIHLNLLISILKNNDPGTGHKRIKILSGGYQKWLQTYPELITNPNIYNQIIESNNERASINPTPILQAVGGPRPPLIKVKLNDKYFDIPWHPKMRKYRVPCPEGKWTIRFNADGSVRFKKLSPKPETKLLT